MLKGGADVFPDGLGGQPQPPPAAGYRIVHLAPSLVERLQPPLPVPADPLGELGGEPLGGDPAPVPPVEELDLEPAEEPLAGGVVRRVPLARHRPLHPGLPAGADPVGGAVVPAAVAVEREAAPGGGHGAGEHLGHERLGRRGAHREGGDVAVEQVDGRREVHLPRVVGQPELGDVGDQDLAGGGGREVVQVAAGVDQQQVGRRRAALLAGVGAVAGRPRGAGAQPLLGHDPAHHLLGDRHRPLLPSSRF